MSAGVTTACPAELEQLVLSRTMLTPPLQCTPLTGGVSSDIHLVSDTSGHRVVAKRALAQLKVAAVWTAPVERSASEEAWLDVAAELTPGFAPRALGRDPESGWLLLDYLDPADHVLWKSELLAGRVDLAVAQGVGTRLGALHAASARDSSALSGRFATDALFDALRLDPYLRSLLGVHPQVAPRVAATIERTASTKLALVHGDVSPKNILIGPDGPVLLDAECAWWGDPAFDLAFVLTHLVAKSHHVEGQAEQLRECARGVLDAHAAHVDWEAVDSLHRRVAELLPAIVLARVDGKSPLEYLDEQTRRTIRQRALTVLQAEPAPLSVVIDALARVQEPDEHH